jgi:hypothetical protein
MPFRLAGCLGLARFRIHNLGFRGHHRVHLECAFRL